MSRRRLTCYTSRLLYSAIGLVWLGASGMAQPPQNMPRVVDIHQRNGMFTRLQPFARPLPHDPYRDNFYGTKYDDRPDGRRPNDWKHGGLYGQFWEPAPSRTIKPYFIGAPGIDTITPDKAPALGFKRWVAGLKEPFRPVKYYYQSGAYVPVYDLDPLVTGPGTFPWPFFYKEKHGGGF